MEPSAAVTIPPEAQKAGQPPAWVQRLGLGLGLVVAVGLLLLAPPAGMSPAAWRTAAVALWMAIWWMTEAIPLAATSLLPLVAFPVLGIATIGDAATPYANPIIFLFMGGMMVALAMERWGLHRRIALGIVHVIGVRPRRIVAGFIVASAFLSMWVSNTATAVMMLPIGLSIVGLAGRGEGVDDTEVERFGIVLLLSIAYACSVGGMATLIGSPTNAVLAAFLSGTYEYDLSFLDWLRVAGPIAGVGLVLLFILLTRVVYPVTLQELPGGAAFLREARRRLGAMSQAEWLVAVVFGGMALLWVTRAWLQSEFGILGGLTDSGVAMAGALILFMLPAGNDQGAVLAWPDARRLPWGVLLLFGGGLSLAAAVNETGLAVWIGASLGALVGWPLLLIVLILVVLVVFLTELTSNTATAAAFLPVLAPIAVTVGENPLMLGIPAVLAASAAFMLPVATPPNAIIYGSGRLTIGHMMRAGIWLNLAFILLVTLAAYLLIPLLLDVELGVVPGWAERGG